jgi:hypothetical protein
MYVTFALRGAEKATGRKPFIRKGQCVNGALSAPDGK